MSRRLLGDRRADRFNPVAAFRSNLAMANQQDDITQRENVDGDVQRNHQSAHEERTEQRHKRNTGEGDQNLAPSFASCGSGSRKPDAGRPGTLCRAAQCVLYWRSYSRRNRRSSRWSGRAKLHDIR